MHRNHGPRTVQNKAESYRLYELGLVGNKPLTWNSYEDIVASGWTGGICVRSKAGTARRNVRYDVPIGMLPEVINDWVTNLKISPAKITFNQSMPNEELTLQGEVMRSSWGMHLTYTNVKKPMNTAFEEEEKYANGLQALMILRSTLWPSDLSDMEALLETYHDSVIEFSSYNIPVGDIPNRNTVIWEVRNY